MRKTIILILLLSLIAVPAFAASQSGMVGMSGGYTSTTGSGTIGFTTSYTYQADINSKVGIGMGIHADLMYVLSHYGGFGAGFLFGLNVETRPTPSTTLSFTVGPAFASHIDYWDYYSFGIGIDAAFTYYFDDHNTTGLTIGATAYPQFLSWGTPWEGKRFDIMAQGYVGFAYRYKGYADNQLDRDPLPFYLY